jgi:methylenetetrahydrofolate dehydrogenase (NADP+)/methenyltetrahydrofolate cyclohydrolase
MGRELNGSELAGFIKERQRKQVLNLRQASKIIPKLLIVQRAQTSHDTVIDTYVRMKQRYAEDILIEVEVVKLTESEMFEAIHAANLNPEIHGIIVQLPLADPKQTDSVLATIAPEKDVDGLGPAALYCSATAEAIDWLLVGYGIDLRGKRIALIGKGRLVGAPLERLWQNRGYTLATFNIDSGDIRESLRNSDVIISATGVAGRLTSDDISFGSIVVDAGTASEKGVVVGDVAADVRTRDDITITPVRGGVGPLTIAVLFDHLIQAARRSADQVMHG